MRDHMPGHENSILRELSPELPDAISLAPESAAHHLRGRPRPLRQAGRRTGEEGPAGPPEHQPCEVRRPITPNLDPAGAEIGVEGR